MTAAYPLQWPEGWKRTPAHARKDYSQSKTTFDRAKRDLMNELRLLKATGVVISSWLPLNRDGTPRADSARRRIDDPGVAVYFMRGEQRVVIARDAYSTVHDNLWSIGLAIQHLRGLERHGGAAMMDRAFTGFAALPPPEVDRHWTEVFGLETSAADWMVEAAYRHHSKTAHPDAGGSETTMAELNAARDQFKKERGL